jgi:hypothetical protein
MTYGFHLHLHVNGKRGVDLLHDPHVNKGTAFTEKERDALGLRGLLPPRVSTLEQQVSTSRNSSTWSRSRTARRPSSTGWSWTTSRR